jgi:hypothetical protein
MCLNRLLVDIAIPKTEQQQQKCSAHCLLSTANYTIATQRGECRSAE